ncbi:hypothetical protein [Nocardia sp. alder85J]|uniref:hypothetical protein n=1 Tax=Nocardia sp. alder85J TaxID=2862949 RepID=UPI001CD2DC4B|nr:hypothetical protein [Nocardia sp. alder85J]MCX4091681.1 hypothetical protein [Nocardia sp. alder85J]
MTDDAAAMRAAAAADPVFVFRHGWSRLRCPVCDEVFYDGRWISPGDMEVMRLFHRIACRIGGGATGSGR